MLKLILLKAVAASAEAALMPDAQYAPTTLRKKERKKKSSIYWLKALPVLIQGSSEVQDGLTPPQVIASYLRHKRVASRKTNASFLQLCSNKTVEGHGEMQLQENSMLLLWDRQTRSKTVRLMHKNALRLESGKPSKMPEVERLGSEEGSWSQAIVS